MREKANNRVALVLDIDFTKKIAPLAEIMPIWIIDTPQNRIAVEKIRNAVSSRSVEPITMFQSKPGESTEQSCERIVQSLDEHHNEYSQTPGYTELMIIGASLSKISLTPFLELEFNQFFSTETGFVAKKQ